jgi:hypothetical protein
LVTLALLLALLEILLLSVWAARRPMSEQAAPQMVMNR